MPRADRNRTTTSTATTMMAMRPRLDTRRRPRRLFCGRSEGTRTAGEASPGFARFRSGTRGAPGHGNDPSGTGSPAAMTPPNALSSASGHRGPSGSTTQWIGVPGATASNAPRPCASKHEVARRPRRRAASATPDRRPATWRSPRRCRRRRPRAPCASRSRKRCHQLALDFGQHGVDELARRNVAGRARPTARPAAAAVRRSAVRARAVARGVLGRACPRARRGRRARPGGAARRAPRSARR